MAKTYAELKAETETRRIESDLQNLASAHILLEEYIIDLQEHIADARSIQQEIDTLGNSESPTLSQVKALYDKAHKARGRR